MSRFEDYKNRVRQDISDQEDALSIPPEVVGKKLTELADIVQTSVAQGPTNDQGLAQPDTDPGTPTTPERYQLETGKTYIHFPDAAGHPITVPLKVGDQYVYSPVAFWDTDHWELLFDLMDVPGLDDFTPLAVFEPVSEDLINISDYMDFSKLVNGDLLNESLPFADVYITAAGVTNSGSGWKSSDFIKVPEGKLLQYNGRIYGTLAKIAFYDVNKVLISTISPGTGHSGTDGDFAFQSNFTVPSGVTYLRYCSYLPGATITQNLKYLDAEPHYSSDKIDQIDLNKEQIISIFANLMNKAEKTTVDSITSAVGLTLYFQGTIINSALPFSDVYITSTGATNSGTGWKSSEYIRVPAEKQLQYNGRIYDTIARIAFYDSNKTLLSTIAPGTGHTGVSGDFVFLKDFITPTGTAYLRYCSYFVGASITQNMKYIDPISYSFSDSIDQISINKTDIISIFSTLIGKAEKTYVESIASTLGFFSYSTGSIINTALPFSDVYITTAGTTNGSAGWKSSDFIRVPANKQLQYNGRIYETIARIAFYDINKTLISTIAPGTGHTGVSGDYVFSKDFTTPNGTAYLRYCSYIVGTVVTQNLKYIDAVNYSFSDKTDQVDLNKVDIVSIFTSLLTKAEKAYVDTISSVLGFISYLTGSIINTSLPFSDVYINSAGTTAASAGWKSSDYIPAPQGRNFQFNGRIFLSVPRIAFYNSSKILISTLDPGTGHTGAGGDVVFQYNFTTPAGTAYLRYCSYTTTPSDVQNLKYLDSTIYFYSQKLNEIDSQLATLGSQLTSITPSAEILIPAKILLVTGVPFIMYFENFITDVKGYSVSIDCSIGTGYLSYWKVTPTTPGTYTMVIRVYRDKLIVTSKTIQLVIKTQSPLSTVKYVNPLGDSLTEPGVTVDTLITKFTSLGGSQPVFKGTKSSGKTEGRSGWRAEDFAGGGLIFHKFVLTGQTQPIQQFGSYTNNGSSYQIYEINVTGGNGYINTVRKSGTNDPLSSGLLTAPAGFTNITFDSWSLGDANPLWNGAALDIGNYRTSKLTMDSGTKFDLVNIQLGINDIGQEPTAILSDATINAKVVYLKNICAAYLADNSLCKIIVQLEPMCNNTAGGFPKLSNFIYYQQNMFKLWKQIIAEFDNGLFNANVSVGVAGLCIHRFEGYPQTTVAPSSRYALLDKVNNNSVHPRTEGYQEIGDNIFHHIYSLL
jgi:lysophospholipase L1-like esterase